MASVATSGLQQKDKTIGQVRQVHAAPCGASVRLKCRASRLGARTPSQRPNRDVASRRQGILRDVAERRAKRTACQHLVMQHLSKYARPFGFQKGVGSAALRIVTVP